MWEPVAPHDVVGDAPQEKSFLVRGRSARMPIRRSSPPGRRLPGGLLTTALTWAPAKKAPAGPGLPGPRQGFKHYASDDFGQPSVVFFPLFVLQDPRDASRGLNEGTKVELKSL